MLRRGPAGGGPALLAALLVVGSARAQPLKTWGGQEGTTSEVSPSEAPLANGTPPEPPKATLGVPVDALPAPEAEGRTAAGASPPRGIGRAGVRYELEGVDVVGNTVTRSRLVLRYVPFSAGDTVDVDDPALVMTRFRLLGTGYFREVELSLKKGSRRGAAVLVVRVTERNTLVVSDVWLGIASDVEPSGAARPVTAFGGVDVTEHNLGGTGAAIGGAVALADRQLALRARFADPQFLGSSWMVEAQLLYNHARDYFGARDVLVSDPGQPTQDFAVITYERFGGLMGAGHDLDRSTRLFVDYRLERVDASFPVAASHRRGLDVEPIDFYAIRGGATLSGLHASLVHDTRDEPVLPTQGSHVSLVADLAPAVLGGDYAFFKVQARLLKWFSLPKQHVLRLEAFGGAISGDAPLFERFYVGDFSDLLPDRVLDLNFDRRAAPNFFSNAIAEVRYGEFAAKLSAEYRVPLYRGQRSIYGIDFFGAAGLYSVAALRDLTQPARGYEALARLPIDVTFNLGVRVSTSVGGFAFGLSTLLGFIPVHAGPQ
jgi:hypothetical protein